METAPLLPVAALPVLKEMEPLSPAEPAFEERTLTEPLV
jgi:hypothetical protein